MQEKTMTPTTLAAALLKDVPRYSLNMLAIEMSKTPHGAWVKLPAVEAALTAAMAPAIAERAREVLERLEIIDPYEEPGRAWNAEGDAIDLITDLLAQNAALRAEVRKSAMDAVSAGCQAQEAYEAQKAAEAERDALRAERDAQRRDLEKTIRNQRAELRRLQALERVHWQSVERWRGTREGLEGKVKAAEAQIAALTARLEGLTGALRDIEADCDADYPPSHGAIKQAARAALSTTEADNEPT